jgi:hypothetical protein
MEPANPPLPSPAHGSDCDADTERGDLTGGPS